MLTNASWLQPDNDFPIEIIGFYTGSRSYPRGGGHFNRTKLDKKITLMDIVEGNVGEDYFIKVDILAKKLHSGS